MFKVCQSIKKVPIINLQPYLNNQIIESDFKNMTEAFHLYGCAVIKDPRINEHKNENFLNLMEKYFSKRQTQYDNGQRGQKVDVYPELQYERGMTPPFVLQAMNYPQLFRQSTLPQNKPLTPNPTQPLSKIRYLWNIGALGPQIPPNKPPQDFPQFQQIMNDWGNSTLATINTVSQILAVGLGLPKDDFTKRLLAGSNKLAPNANDLRRCKPGQPFTDLHYDFSFMTIHGKSKFPGLFIWLTTGQKLKVSIPKGYLFVQAGSELEYATGGFIKSGFHQAINTPQVEKARDQYMKSGKQPWRISSTMFTHFRSDCLVEPLGKYRTEQTLKKYPPINQYDYFIKELYDNRAS